jgi:hypothetical protein
MGADAGQPMAILVRLGRLGEQNEAREERRDRIGKVDLGDDAVGLLLLPALFAVPVPRPAVVLQILEGVLVLAPPGVEILKEFGVKVLAILGVAAAGVRVCRDDRVVVRRGHQQFPL